MQTVFVQYIFRKITNIKYRLKYKLQKTTQNYRIQIKRKRIQIVKNTM